MHAGYTQIPLMDPEMDYKKTDAAFNYAPFDPTRSKTHKSIFEFTKMTDGDQEPDAKSSFVFKCLTVVMTVLCYIGFVITLPISGWFCLKTVHNYERLVIFRLGHLKGPKGPGLCLVLPCIDRVVKVDLRMKAFSVPPQKILTSDNAAIEGGADIYYRVADPVCFVTGIQDLDNSIRALCQTTLQNHMSKQLLGDIEANRPAIGSVLQDNINRTTKSWGVEVSRVDISQIKVIQGPTVSNTSQAHNLLNMIAPGLLPAGTGGASLPPGVSGSGPSSFSQPHPHASSPNPNMDMFASLMSGGFMPPTTGTHQTQGMKFMSNPHELIAKVQANLSADLVREFGMVYKFTVEGTDGSVFYLDLKHGAGSAGVGEPQGIPDATLTLTTETMTRIMGGELSAFSAYMSGELKICGDVHGAMKLGQVLDRLK